MASTLVRLHAAVREAVARAPAETRPVPGPNPKGDIPRRFDLVAEDRARAFLEREVGEGILLSEESGESHLGNAEPRLLFLLDPVDGSDNHARGLPLSSVSVAILPAGGPIAPRAVQWAIVGGLEEEVPLLAGRGRGAWRGAERLRSSRVRRIEKAFLSCELNHFAPPPALGSLLSRARAVRSFGRASRAIALVASGALDAHIDVRGRLTPESFYAAALILEEAGGCLVDPVGKLLGQADGITHRTRLIAAATSALAREIVEALGDGSS
jgi:myo-inositol-1(or 4)-monophosphatase